MEQGNFLHRGALNPRTQLMKVDMGLGKGALLWLIGIPIPMIIVLMLFMHH